MTRARFLLFLVAAAGLLLMGPTVLDMVGGEAAAEEETPEPDSVCADPKQEFLAYQTPDAKFGPPVEQRKLDEVQKELHRRRCLDPALVVAHQEFYGFEAKGQPYRTEADRAFWVGFYKANREEHTKAVAALEHFEATEMAKAEVRKIRTDNESMWMVDSQPQPTIVVGPSDVTEFDALVFTDGNGKEYTFKLDCGFQPMVPEGTPLPPLPPPGTPPPTVPPCNCPEPTVPPCTDCNPNPCPDGCPTTEPPTSEPPTSEPRKCGNKAKWEDKNTNGRVDDGECVVPITTVAPNETSSVSSVPLPEVEVPATAAPDTVAEWTDVNVIDDDVPESVTETEDGNTGVEAEEQDQEVGTPEGGSLPEEGGGGTTTR